MYGLSFTTYCTVSVAPSPHGYFYHGQGPEGHTHLTGPFLSPTVNHGWQREEKLLQSCTYLKLKGNFPAVQRDKKKSDNIIAPVNTLRFSCDENDPRSVVARLRPSDDRVHFVHAVRSCTAYLSIEQ